MNESHFQRISFTTAMNRIYYHEPVFIRNVNTDEIEQLYREDMLIKYRITSLQSMMTREYYCCTVSMF